MLEIHSADDKGTATGCETLLASEEIHAAIRGVNSTWHTLQDGKGSTDAVVAYRNGLQRNLKQRMDLKQYNKDTYILLLSVMQIDVGALQNTLGQQLISVRRF